ncbi:MAG: hypothetical protein AB8B83_02380 [Bdellovibrionales bacterium]
MSFFVLKAPVSRESITGQDRLGVTFRHSYNAHDIQGMFLNNNGRVSLELTGQTEVKDLAIANAVDMPALKRAWMTGLNSGEVKPKLIDIEERKDMHRSKGGVITLNREAIVSLEEFSGTAYDDGSPRPTVVTLRNGSSFQARSFNQIMDQLDGGPNYRAEIPLGSAALS